MKSAKAVPLTIVQLRYLLLGSKSPDIIVLRLLAGTGQTDELPLFKESLIDKDWLEEAPCIRFV